MKALLAVSACAPNEVSSLYFQPAQASTCCLYSIPFFAPPPISISNASIFTWAGVSGVKVRKSFDSTLSSSPDPQAAYEILDFELKEIETVTGIKIIGQAPETGPEMVLLELDSMNERPAP